MEFSISERLMLMNLLPKEGDITMVRIVRDLQGELGFSEEDNEALKFVQEGGNVKWDVKGAEQIGLKEVEVGKAARKLVVKTLEDLSEQSKLPLAYVDLWDKFVDDEDDA